MTPQEIRDEIMREPEAKEPVEPHWLVSFGGLRIFTSTKTTRAEAIEDARQRALALAMRNGKPVFDPSILPVDFSAHVPLKPGGEFQWGPTSPFNRSIHRSIAVTAAVPG